MAGSRRPGARLFPALASAAIGAAVATIGSAEAGSLFRGSDTALDRVAVAVDGVEFSHGADPRMWRPEADGPQGPMQVSAAAAVDAGGGNRFDLGENRALGRAYLARLYRHFGTWSDAIAAYNWGPGNMDAWIGSGRQADRLPLSVAVYRVRVLYGGVNETLGGGHMPTLGIVHAQPRRPEEDRRHPSRDTRVVDQLYGAIMSASKAH